MRPLCLLLAWLMIFPVRAYSQAEAEALLAAKAKEPIALSVEKVSLVNEPAFIAYRVTVENRGDQELSFTGADIRFPELSQAPVPATSSEIKTQLWSEMSTSSSYSGSSYPHYSSGCCCCGYWGRGSNDAAAVIVGIILIILVFGIIIILVDATTKAHREAKKDKGPVDNWNNTSPFSLIRGESTTRSYLLRNPTGIKPRKAYVDLTDARGKTRSLELALP